MIKHKIIHKRLSNVIVLFHGTGGDENDLLDIGSKIDPEATLIGLRGNIIEGTLNRFFKRKAPGIFDIENLIYETKLVKETLEELSRKHHFDLKNTTLVGYSNGANMIGSLVYHYGKFVKSTILMHPMIPIKDFKVSNLDDLDILITAGENDPICSLKESKKLKEILTENHGKVKINWYNFGHRISNYEINDVAKWYQNQK
jgi:phospholipase/carboxylesterase